MSLTAWLRFSAPEVEEVVEQREVAASDVMAQFDLVSTEHESNPHRNSTSRDISHRSTV